MTIETKYNIGDKVWWEQGSTAKGGTIEYIEVNYERSKYDQSQNEKYTIRGFDDVLYTKFDDEYLYPTKEELLKSL